MVTLPRQVTTRAVPVAVFGSARSSVNTSTALVVTADPLVREAIRRELSAMRWSVLEAGGGAEAMMLLDVQQPTAVLLDTWLPDLEAGEFARQLRLLYPELDLLNLDGTAQPGAVRSARRHELLHALREAQRDGAGKEHRGPDLLSSAAPVEEEPTPVRLPPATDPVYALPEMVGDHESMRELGRLIRLVAPTDASVLIEGETGTGKELVARAVHRLSDRASKPFIVLNCAAIPEQLLEAELFGHTRGAFTGAVVSRTGRIEAAHGGTLFLDEIGEMPLPLQAKMLRFLECGELQRIGDNDVSRVNVRVIAATHRDLEQHAVDGTFREDLYHRLAVFPVQVAPLRERMEDLPMLVEAILKKLGETMPRRSISGAALIRLQQYAFPGNVRELAHVLQRAAILCGSRAEIQAEEIRVRLSGMRGATSGRLAA